MNYNFNVRGETADRPPGKEVALKFELARRTKRSSFATRSSAADLRARISSAATDDPEDDVLEIDLSGVEAMTISFADELIAKLAAERRIFGNDDSFFLISNGSPEVIETIEVALDRRNLFVAHRKRDGRQTLLAAGMHLQETFRVAQDLGEFTAKDLAEALGLSAPAANNRIKLLAQAGAVTRVRHDPAGGGRQYIYLAAAA